MTRGRRFSADFKAKIALEVLRGDLVIQDIADRHKAHPDQVSRWKKQEIDGMGDVCSDKREKASSDRESEIHDLPAKIGELTIDRDFLSRGLKRLR